VFAWCTNTLEKDCHWVLECFADMEAVLCRLFWGLHARPGIAHFRPIAKSLTRFRVSYTGFQQSKSQNITM
jgi:hypothetical protein